MEKTDIPKHEIRILINDRLEKVQAEIYILGDASEKRGDPFTGLVLGAVQLGKRKWQFYDLVSGHRFHEQRRTFRSPKQGMKHLEDIVRQQKFVEGLSLLETAERAWLYSWAVGVPLLVNPVVDHLPEHIGFDAEDFQHNMVAAPCPKCGEENWTLHEPEERPKEFPPDWKPVLGLKCRSCGIHGPQTCHGIPHAMFRWNGLDWAKDMKDE